jgi:catechol 2,3-dioxygenase-like lactoylglutathione lyase family enzyme
MTIAVLFTWPCSKESAKEPPVEPTEKSIQLKYVSLLVDDQQKALKFYTNTLGFNKVADRPLIADDRWITVAPPDGIEGIELVLEPAIFPPAQTYQSALFEAGIPAVMFITNDIDADFQRLSDKGVVFRGEPTEVQNLKLVMFEDTCGNLIRITQVIH